MKQKIYISGKITGLPTGEVADKFKRAEQEVKELGFDSVNPLDNGLDSTASWSEHMKKDIEILLGCTAIYMLRDCHDSKGAALEYCIAGNLNFLVIHQPLHET